MSSASPLTPVRSGRRCSRTACGGSAVATLTYVYADQTAVLGPLATYAEPHAYDLCDQHSERLSAPRGWEVVRLSFEPVDRGPSEDDLLALADAVREAGRPLRSRPEPGVTAAPAPGGPAGPDPLDDPTRGVRRGHLRVLSTD